MPIMTSQILKSVAFKKAQKSRSQEQNIKYGATLMKKNFCRGANL